MLFLFINVNDKIYPLQTSLIWKILNIFHILFKIAHKIVHKNLVALSRM